MADVLGDLVGAAPGDGITRVRFSQTSDLLLAASWDDVGYYYDGCIRECGCVTALLLTPPSVLALAECLPV